MLAFNQKVNAGTRVNRKAHTIRPWEAFVFNLSNFSTKMGDELLGNVHPFEKFLEEAVGKTLLNRGNVLLHVLQTPAHREKME